MLLFLYYILLGVYGIVLAVCIFYFLSKKAPTGDASIGWSIGVAYTGGLAVIVLLASLLWRLPALGLAVLSIPPIVLLLPRARRAWTRIYARLPVLSDTPPLTLFIENNTPSKLHIKLECWFSTSEKHRARLFTTLDYFPEPLEKSSFLLTAFQTNLLAHKSQYVGIMIYEQVLEEYEGFSHWKEIQPCMQFYNEQPEAFRAGEYTVVIDAK